MEIITKQFNVYKFSELAQDLQDKLMEQCKQDLKNEMMNDSLLDCMEDKARELLQDTFGNKAIFKEVCYDLGYAQGSGAMIEFELNLDSNVVLEIQQVGQYCNSTSFAIAENNIALDEHVFENLRSKIATINRRLEVFGYNFMESEPPIEMIMNTLESYLYLECGEVFGIDNEEERLQQQGGLTQ